jgi:hypothetical protein
LFDMILFITFARYGIEGRGVAIHHTDWSNAQKRGELNDFYGRLLSLNFSAWCPRCLTASWEIETGIQEFIMPVQEILMV